MVGNGRSAAGQKWGGRLSRLPLVLLLAVGMLLSLMHCAECGPQFADTGGIPVATGNSDHGPAPDHPAGPALCHSGHCLSHVTATPAAAINDPATVIPFTPRDGKTQVLISFADLGLFKPPRA